MYKIQKHLQNVMLVEMASEISKKEAFKCVDPSRHNGIKGAMTKTCSLRFKKHTHLVMSPLIRCGLEQFTDSVYVYFVMILLAIPTQIKYWKGFVSCSFTFGSLH